MTVTHESGDSIDANNAKIVSTVEYNSTASGSSVSSDTDATWQAITTDSDISAGSSATIGFEGSTGTDFGGETIRVVYDNPDSDSSSTLGKFEVPDN